jgi:hypothetical protein
VVSFGMELLLGLAGTHLGAKWQNGRPYRLKGVSEGRHITGEGLPKVTESGPHRDSGVCQS